MVLCGTNGDQCLVSRVVADKGVRLVTDSDTKAPCVQLQLQVGQQSRYLRSQPEQPDQVWSQEGNRWPCFEGSGAWLWPQSISDESIITELPSGAQHTLVIYTQTTSVQQCPHIGSYFSNISVSKLRTHHKIHNTFNLGFPLLSSKAECRLLRQSQLFLGGRNELRPKKTLRFFSFW